jgi:hypothetical protein
MPLISKRPKEKLPQEALDQFQTILDEYDCLRANQAISAPGDDAHMAKLRKTLDERPETLWWSDMLLAEFCLVDMLNAEQVRATLGGWRRRLHEVASATQYADYIAHAPDLTREKDPKRLKADLCSCMQAVYFFYGAYGVAARSRTDVTISLMRAALMVLAFEALIGLLLFVRWSDGAFYISLPSGWGAVIAWMLATSSAAVVGSVVSVQRRLQDPSVEVDPYFRYIQTHADWFGTAVVSPVFAAIFGIVLYGLLASKLLSTSIINLSGGTPATPADDGTLLIFGFIAGFAEQLIPDALTRIAARGFWGLANGKAKGGGGESRFPSLPSGGGSSDSES